MKNKVVSGGQQAAPMVHGGKSDHYQPAWMGSPILALAITAFITLSAIFCGQGTVKILGISYGWAFIVAGAIVVAEMFGLAAAAARIRATYQQTHAEPPVKPFDLAA